MSGGQDWAAEVIKGDAEEPRGKLRCIIEEADRPGQFRVVCHREDGTQETFRWLTIKTAIAVIKTWMSDEVK